MLLFMKDIFAGYGILSWQLFSFNKMKITLFCPLASIAAHEKSAVSPMAALL